MTEQLQEQVSALVDEELPEQEVSLVLRRLASDDSLRDTFARYHTIGAVIRGLGPDLASADFADGVRARIAAETHQVEAAPGAWQRWSKPAGMAAAAASVALVALVGLRTVSTGVEPDAPAIAQVAPDVTPVAQAVDYVVPVLQKTQDEHAARIAQHLVSHGAYVRTAGRSGVMNYRMLGNEMQTAAPAEDPGRSPAGIASPADTASEPR